LGPGGTLKGIVFNILQQVIADEHGERVWDDVLEAAGSKGVYTAVGSYADEDLISLVGAAAGMLDTSPDDLVRDFGRKAIPHFAERYPQFFAPHADTRSFVLTLNEVIHPEVRKLFPGADVPTFEFSLPDERTVELAYVSARRLCSFAEGLVLGAADHYGETVEMRQTSCLKRGDPRCVLVCTFARVGEPVGS
jgi:predicted hydrocarbon binding protein